ncbi:MAG: TadE/TadG family type IV pilus assembly protein [Bacillota bacterium]|nr:TadE/TadG family type IV pilus assembly protein [Bacillota bacterium]
MERKSFRRGESGQAALEIALVLPVFIGLLFSTIALVLAFDARMVTTDAARNAARTVSIECAQPGMNWAGDAAAVAERNLRDGGLNVGQQVGGKPSAAGQWSVTASCTGEGGTASVTVTYAQVNLFPPLALIFPFHGPDAHAGPGTWVLSASATYPVE